MRLLIKAAKKGKRTGLVPVKRVVRGKKGKAYTQTFYVRPDEVKTATPVRPSVSEESPYPKGALGGSELYMRLGVTAGDKFVRIPDAVVREKFDYKGFSFAVHPPWNSKHQAFFDSDAKLIVTELSTGMKVAQYEQITTAVDATKTAKEQAIARIDHYGTRGLAEAIARAGAMEDKYPAQLVVENPGVLAPLTDNDLKRLAEYIYTDILGEGDIFEDDYPQGRIDTITDWIHLSGDYVSQSDVDETVSGTLDPSEREVIEVAIKMGESTETARHTAEALGFIMSGSGAESHTSVDYDTVMDWWESVGTPELYSSDLKYLIVQDKAGNSVEHDQIIAHAISHGVTLKYAKEWAKQYLSDTYGIAELEFTDQHGIDWEGSALMTVASWVAGESITTERAKARDYDRHIRSGGSANPDLRNDMLRVVEDHRVISQEKRLFRGTNWDAWKKAKVGQKLDFGIGSFSKSINVAHQFMGYHGTLLHLVPPPPAEGIDIDSLIESVRNEGVSPDETLAMFEQEQEWVVRSPSLEVVKIFEKGDEDSPDPLSYVVRVRVADMDLVKSQQDDAALRDHLEQLYLSFNDPLSHRKPHTPITLKEWTEKKRQERG